MEEEKKNKPHVFAKRKFCCNMLYPLTESSCLYMMAFICHWICGLLGTEEREQ